jgi:hypothetical protein
MRYFCRTAHLPGDGIIAHKILFFFAFLASFRDQLPRPPAHLAGDDGIDVKNLILFAFFAFICGQLLFPG